jgi:hypothetical protein
MQGSPNTVFCIQQSDNNIEGKVNIHNFDQLAREGYRVMKASNGAMTAAWRLSLH